MFRKQKALARFARTCTLTCYAAQIDVALGLPFVAVGSKALTFDATRENGSQEMGNFSVEHTRHGAQCTNKMAQLIFALFLAFLMNSAQARSQENTWKLVCFTQPGLERILSRIVNTQQFLRNSMGQTVTKKEMSRAGCDYAKVPAGTVADPSGFFLSQKGFIFPVFQLRYATTNHKMYSADGIFESHSWVLMNARESYIGNQGEIEVRSDRARKDRLLTQKLAPKNCNALKSFLQQSRNLLPDYMVIPGSCRRSYTTH